MLIAVLMPGAIGTVVYFLLRQPLVAPCPGCGSSIESGSNFCRQCRFQVGRVCQVCHRSARATDVYCLHCGHELALDPAPQRLRAYQE
jgi:predicted amidophosphoribosyltransferase